jgi:hypothetical protein
MQHKCHQAKVHARSSQLLVVSVGSEKVSQRIFGRPEWHMQYPSSSVSAERAFGAMKAIEPPQRHAMKEPTLEAELMCRCNNWVVQGLRDGWAEALHTVLRFHYYK